MQHATLYTHDRHQIAVFHEPSGYVAIADRTFVACARADEVRTGFGTSFFLRSDPLWRSGVFTPRGEACVEPTAEQGAWRDAVVETFDRLVRLPALDRHFADIQAMWSSGSAP